jgi:hypothetical protein
LVDRPFITFTEPWSISSEFREIEFKNKGAAHVQENKGRSEILGTTRPIESTILCHVPFVSILQVTLAPGLARATIDIQIGICPPRCIRLIGD